MFFTDRVLAKLRHEAHMRAMQKAQELERDAVEEFRKAQAQRPAINDVDHLRQHVKELQDLLGKQKELTQFWQNRFYAASEKLQEISDIANGE